MDKTRLLFSKSINILRQLTINMTFQLQRYMIYNSEIEELMHHFKDINEIILIIHNSITSVFCYIYLSQLAQEHT